MVVVLALRKQRTDFEDSYTKGRREGKELNWTKFAYFAGKSPSESPVPKRVGLAHISQVILEVDGNRVTLSQENTQDSLPLQQKILVCSLLLLTRRLKIKEVTLGKVSFASQQVGLRLCQSYFPKGPGN